MITPLLKGSNVLRLWGLPYKKISHGQTNTKKVAAGIGFLRRIRDFTSFCALIKIYKTVIEPHFDYACTVWEDMDATLALKLQKLQNRAARIITKSDYEVRSADIFKNIGWKTLQNRQYDLKEVND